MCTALYFDYPSTAKIRIRKENCYYNEQFPYVYRIKTKRLDFLIPRRAVLFGENYVYIPNSVYKNEIDKLYKSIKNVSY